MLTLASPTSPNTESDKVVATQPGGRVNEPRLDSLTSLRFIAAAMIVTYHSVGIFHMDPNGAIEKLPLAQGVSFFFVLSGFILTYVYKNLSGLKSTLKFLSARVARVWPVFAFSAVLTYLISPGTMVAKEPGTIAATVVSQFFMLHGWIPERMFYFSIDSPSWSISTEFFFYLAFPLLILNLRSNWITKFFAVAGLPIMMMVICHAAHLPTSGPEAQPDQHGMLYINPVSRIFEFYLGMLTCFMVVGLRKQTLNRALITSLEVAAFALTAFVICNIDGWLAKPFFYVSYPEISEYLRYCGNAVCYVLLITIIGLERGWISKALNFPVLVFLGEVSYSAYLLHYPLIAAYRIHSDVFLTMPRLLRYGLFWALLIAGSALAYTLLEKPARTSLRKIFDAGIAKLKLKST